MYEAISHKTVICRCCCCYYYSFCCCCCCCYPTLLLLCTHRFHRLNYALFLSITTITPFFCALYRIQCQSLINATNSRAIYKIPYQASHEFFNTHTHTTQKMKTKNTQNKTNCPYIYISSVENSSTHCLYDCFIFISFYPLLFSSLSES